MIIPDVNVLVHLHRDDHPQHQVAHQWWRELLARGESLTVPDLIWVGFMRLVTNRRVYREPSTSEEAWLFVESVHAQGVYIEYASHPRLLKGFGARVLGARASADLVTDAYIASAAAALGASLVTFDRDFRRFDGVAVVELR